MAGMTRAGPLTTACRPGDPIGEGWRAAAWSAVIAGALVLCFAGVIAVSAYSDLVQESGGDDSLAPLGLVISAVVGAPAALALVVAGLSFVRTWAPTARKALIVMAATVVALEVFAVLAFYAGNA